MVAVLPGEPQTSSVMVLALNWSRTSPDEPPPNEPLVNAEDAVQSVDDKSR